MYPLRASGSAGGPSLIWRVIPFRRCSTATYPRVARYARGGTISRIQRGGRYHFFTTRLRTAQGLGLYDAIGDKAVLLFA